MLSLAPGETQRVTTVSTPPYLPARRAAVVAIRVAAAQGPLTIVAAGSLDAADGQVAQAAEAGAVACALCLVVVAGVAWLTAGRALRPVDELLAALEQAAERQRRFVADAAHELRTPLAGLTTALEVARDHPASSDPATLAAELLDGHRRLGRLVNDLLVLASLDGQVPLRSRPIDLAGVVADSVRRRTPQGVALRARRVERAVVLGDEAHLGRMLTNLVDNALRYARTAVEVSLTIEDGEAVIAVADDGPGVPPGDRERVWERFVRLDGDRSRATGGTGLGLALVRELASAHGGGVAIAEPESARGSVFLVRLPLRDGA